MADLSREQRGGSFLDFASALEPSFGGGLDPTREAEFIGFRLAMIPEPSSLAVAAFGLISLAAWDWRKRFRT